VFVSHHHILAAAAHIAREEKPMRPLLIILPLLGVLAACKQQAPAPAKPDEPVATPAAAASASPAAVPSAPAPQASPRALSEANDLYDFVYAYPAAAAAIPALRSFLEADLNKQRAKLIAQAKEGQQEAKQADIEYRAYYGSTEWQVVADVPGWLSLSAVHGSYAGGAHPNHWSDSLLWDKAAGKQRAASDLFTSKAALSKVIRKQFCRDIDKQRSQKRGEPVKAGSDELFSNCIDPLGQVVILGSSNRQTFDRIGILVAPYEAGPYAEGDYEVTLPVTAEIMAVVKPEFRDSFSVTR
jgi:hypothetical protein